MRQRLAIVLVTVLAFAIGLGAGIWVEKHQPIPPPPGMPGGEFSRHHLYAPAGYGIHRPPSREELVREVRALRPQIEAFQKKMADIDVGFSSEFDAILNPEQRALHGGRMKVFKDARDRITKTSASSDDHLLFALADMSTRTILWDMVVPLRLDSLSETYKLDDLQREKVRALLVARRQKVIELIDSAPPPTVMLHWLAPLVQRTAHPEGPPSSPAPAPAKP